MATDWNWLPSDLPVPEDDGAADHLPGMDLPELALPVAGGAGAFDLRRDGLLVAFVYPRTGTPGQPNPPGWDDIPGARGCTPQSCAFRDRFPRFRVPVAGLSAQSLDDQIEFAERNRMPFPVIADPELELGAALDLPTFEVEGELLYKRLTLVAENARVVKVFYPVFPPDENAEEVLAFLEGRGHGLRGGVEA
jgi:peroxiredoxin